jgi:F0F1-type ATP synthase membrane subunit c/vacuolar-type H+-ATPase subunit K
MIFLVGLGCLVAGFVLGIVFTQLAIRHSLRNLWW